MYQIYISLLLNERKKYEIIPRFVLPKVITHCNNIKKIFINTFEFQLSDWLKAFLNQDTFLPYYPCFLPIPQFSAGFPHTAYVFQTICINADHIVLLNKIINKT